MNRAILQSANLDEVFAGKETAPEDDLLLMVSFSGGGTRAAALAYGVLELLNQQSAGANGEGRMLDQLDYISAVSGGSFTAAYYALFGKRLFADFKAKLLEKDLHAAIRQQFLKGETLKRISSEQYGVSDLLADYYDREIFEQKTLSDLFAANGLVVDINAVDISRGTRFSFNKSQLRIICTDPKSITVGRAVAASSAVPVVFSAISIRNYADQCHEATPQWVTQALNDSNDTRRQYEAKRVHSYLNPGKRKYIHLLDGGLADNLGVRASIARTLSAGSLKKALDSRGLGHTKRIVYIVVDAANWPPVTMDESANHPPLESIISAATSAPIVQYNIETLNLLRQQFTQWSEETGGEAHVIHLSFDQLPEAQREEMLAMPTNLALLPEQVDKVIQAGKALLKGHPEYGRWVSQ
jgi:NTE family protein